MLWKPAARGFGVCSTSKCYCSLNKQTLKEVWIVSVQVISRNISRPCSLCCDQRTPSDWSVTQYWTWYCDIDWMSCILVQFSDDFLNCIWKWKKNNKVVFLVYVSFNFTGFTFCKTVFDQILMCSCVTLETYEGLCWFVAQALEASPRKKKTGFFFSFFCSTTLFVCSFTPGCSSGELLPSGYPVHGGGLHQWEAGHGGEHRAGDWFPLLW